MLADVRYNDCILIGMLLKLGDNLLGREPAVFTGCNLLLLLCLNLLNAVNPFGSVFFFNEIKKSCDCVLYIACGADAGIYVLIELRRVDVDMDYP